MRTCFVSILLLLLVVLAITGCKKGKAEVEINGAITYNGEPIELGIIQFTTETNEGGGNIADGNYTAKVPTGELTVRVRGYRYTGPMPEAVEPKPGDPPQPPPQRPREPMMPEDFWLNPTFKIKIDKPGTYDIKLEG